MIKQYSGYSFAGILNYLISKHVDYNTGSDQSWTLQLGEFRLAVLYFVE